MQCFMGLATFKSILNGNNCFTQALNLNHSSSGLMSQIKPERFLSGQILQQRNTSLFFWISSQIKGKPKEF